LVDILLSESSFLVHLQTVPFEAVPRKVEALRAERIVQVAAGSYHCLAVTAEGRVYQWGKLYKLGETKQYFGGVVKLTGMKDSSIQMIDRSHKLYYNGNVRFIYHLKQRTRSLSL
jgi:alpha-tubulin suppressor-like RCC1 family protein